MSGPTRRGGSVTLEPDERSGARAPEGRVLGVDLGSRRIGLAVSDDQRRVASALVMLPRGGSREGDHSRLAAVVARDWGQPGGCGVTAFFVGRGRTGRPGCGGRGRGAAPSLSSRSSLRRALQHGHRRRALVAGGRRPQPARPWWTRWPRRDPADLAGPTASLAWAEGAPGRPSQPSVTHFGRGPEARCHKRLSQSTAVQ